MKKVLSKIWDFLMALAEARSAAIRSKAQYRGY